MDIAQETDDYIRESIEQSLGRIENPPVEASCFRGRPPPPPRSDLSLARSTQTPRSGSISTGEIGGGEHEHPGLRKCIEDKEEMVVEYGNLSGHYGKLEKECMLYERDLEKSMESCDEFGQGE